MYTKLFLSILITMYAVACANLTDATHNVDNETTSTFEQENPFMQMAGKKYADYALELRERCFDFVRLDTVEARKIICQIEEVAKKTGQMEWKLQVEYLELLLFKHKLDLLSENAFFSEEWLQNALELLEKAKKAKILQLELKFRQEIIEYYWYRLKNYELVFEQFVIQDEHLQKLSPEIIPEKIYYYQWIAYAYFFFKDYDKAIFYYNKIFDEKENLQSPDINHARNSLGILYRDGYNDLDRSDSCFQAIINAEYLPAYQSTVEAWKGIAEGNLGNNMYLRGDYGRAIPLLKSSLEIMLKADDYGYSVVPAVIMADIYLKTGNVAESKRYIDLANEYYRINQQEESYLPRIYEVMSKYYAVTGNKKLSITYLDSMLAVKKQYDSHYNAVLLLQLEQKESAKQHQQFVQEKMIQQQTKHQLWMLFAGTIIIFSLLGYVFVIYNRQRRAYRVLVRKSQEWAQVNPVMELSGSITENKTIIPSNEIEKQNEPANESDLVIMKAILNLMMKEKLYRDANLSVDLLAHKIGAKRHYVSTAINRCMNRSFNTFVNEYRIREAIQVLSKNDNNAFTIDAVAYDTGFNDRNNFYRVFKKMTGLSPTDFRKNVVKQ